MVRQERGSMGAQDGILFKGSHACCTHIDILEPQLEARPLVGSAVVLILVVLFGVASLREGHEVHDDPILLRLAEQI